MSKTGKIPEWLVEFDLYFVTSIFALEYLLSRDQDYVPEQPTVEADIDPEQDDRFTEYYTSRQEPVPEGVVPFGERIRLEEGLYLFDTPGMLWPKIVNQNSGYRLAVTSAVKDTAFDHDEIACFAAEYLLEAYPDRLKERYKLEELPVTEVELIEAIGRKRGCVKSGGYVDFHKASAILINEIRDKTLGPLTFESPNMVEKEVVYFDELEAKKIAEREDKKEARGRGRKNKPKKKKR